MNWLEWLLHPTWVTEVFIAALASLVLFFIFGKKAELSRNAIENTVTTLVVAGLNLLIVLWFLNDLNALAQSTYKAMNIPTLPADIWDNLPFWLVCLIGIVAKDFVDYWNHRLMHTTWGWPTHAAHHSDTHVNAFTATRIHFIEAFLVSCSYILVLTWLQMPQVVPVVVLIYMLHSKYIHMDLPFQHGWLKLLIASPVFHRWHHADEPEAYGKNLATVIPLWDVLFGTYYNPGLCNAPMGALKTGVEDKNSIKIMLYPVQEWGRLIRQAYKRRAEPAGYDTRDPAGSSTRSANGPKFTSQPAE